MSKTMNGTESGKGQIRLCYIIKWDDYDGYGFNLHAEKNKPGQFIGKVDDGSPAEAAGLKEGDRIIEVNGTNITSEDHKTVVKKIKDKLNETCLLVADKESVEYYNKKNIPISSLLPEVVTIKTPPRPAQVNGNPNGNATEGTPAINGISETELQPTTGDVIGNQKEPKTTESDTVDTPHKENTTPNGKQRDNESQRLIEKEMTSIQNGMTNGKKDVEKEVAETAPVALSVASESPKSQKSLTSSEGKKSMTSSEGGKEDKGKLNLNMSAEEFRMRLALRKKYDPKKDNMDVKKKYDIIDQL